MPNNLKHSRAREMEFVRYECNIGPELSDDRDWFLGSLDHRETWNPDYNSDYFDPDEIDEYGIDVESFYEKRHDTSIDYEEERDE